LFNHINEGIDKWDDSTLVVELMMLLLNLTLFIVGILFIVIGGNKVTDAGIEIGAKLKLTGVAVGAIFMALITAMPETFISGYAALLKNSDVAFGNLIGSNIHNIPLTIGIATFFTALTFEKFASRISLIMLLSILFAFLLLSDGQATPLKGFILISGYIMYIIFVIKHERNNNHKLTQKTNKSLKVLSLTFIGSGFILLLGSYLIVTSSLKIAELLGISNILIGLTIVAFGSIIPEFSVSLIAAIKKHDSVCVCNLLGDNIMTILVVLGIVSILNPFSINMKEMLLTFIPMFILTFLLFLVTLKKDRKITRIHGVIFIVVYILILTLQTIFLG